MTKLILCANKKCSLLLLFSASFPFLLLSLFFSLLSSTFVLPAPLSFYLLFQNGETLYLFLKDSSASSTAILRCTAVDCTPRDSTLLVIAPPVTGTISFLELLVSRESTDKNKFILCNMQEKLRMDSRYLRLMEGNIFNCIWWIDFYTECCFSVE